MPSKKKKPLKKKPISTPRKTTAKKGGCTDGETRFIGMHLFVCKNGKWKKSPLY